MGLLVGIKGLWIGNNGERFVIDSETNEGFIRLISRRELMPVKRAGRSTVVVDSHLAESCGADDDKKSRKFNENLNEKFTAESAVLR